MTWKMAWTTAVVALPCWFAACAESQAGSAETTANTVTSARTESADYRATLLDLAFETSSAFPRNPHIKNRSRAQEAVVSACLELDRADRALQYIPRIDNWRRGKAYADLAYHEARLGRMAHVQDYLDRAQRIADGSGLESHGSPSDTIESPQEWRRDRIRTTIAQTYILLGQPEKATRIAEDAVDSEIGRVHAEQARRAGAETFDDQLAAIEPLVKTGAFEQLNAALQAYSQLFARFYDDADRRAIVEDKIVIAWAKLPIQVRLDVTMELADHAFAHDDAPKALELIDRAQTMLGGTQWNAESHVPMRAKLAAYRFRAGDHGRARTEVDATLAAYESGRESIVNMYRAGVLRPVAEAYVAIGDTEQARAVYALTLEEGWINPNSRPRADDLSATATSMAVHGFEPDATMLESMRAMQAGLGDPW